MTDKDFFYAPLIYVLNAYTSIYSSVYSLYSTALVARYIELNAAMFEARQQTNAMAQRTRRAFPHVAEVAF